MAPARLCERDQNLYGKTPKVPVTEAAGRPKAHSMIQYARYSVAEIVINATYFHRLPSWLSIRNPCYATALILGVALVIPPIQPVEPERIITLLQRR